MTLHRPADFEQAHLRWGANCGPAAIAAALGLELADVREAVSGGRRKFRGYMGWFGLFMER